MGSRFVEITKEGNNYTVNPNPSRPLSGVYGATASLYNTSFTFLSDVEITSFEYYTGEETEIEDAIQDTQNWQSESIAFSDNAGDVYNAIVEQTYGSATFIKLTDSSGDIYACRSSDLGSSFSSISKF